MPTKDVLNEYNKIINEYQFLHCIRSHSPDSAGEPSLLAEYQFVPLKPGIQIPSRLTVRLSDIITVGDCIHWSSFRRGQYIVRLSSLRSFAVRHILYCQYMRGRLLDHVLVSQQKNVTEYRMVTTEFY